MAKQTNRNKHWTREEDNMVMDAVIQFAKMRKNKTEAFNHVSKKLSGRTPKACSFRFFKVLSKLPYVRNELAKVEGGEYVPTSLFEEETVAPPKIELPFKVVTQIETMKKQYGDDSLYNIALISDEYSEIAEFISDPTNARDYFDALRFGYMAKEQLPEEIIKEAYLNSNSAEFTAGVMFVLRQLNRMDILGGQDNE